MTQQVRELLRDAMGKQAFDALSLEERKRMTGIMRDMVAQSGLDKIRDAVKANKGKITPAAQASGAVRQETSLSSGSMTVLLPLLAALQASEQPDPRENLRAGTPEPLASEHQEQSLSSPLPDPLAPPAPPKPAWAN